jgi:hypothetical protein
MGAYVLSSRTDTLNLPEAKENYCLTIEEIDNTVIYTPTVREISCSETSRDNYNWIIRAKREDGPEIKLSDDYATQGNHSMEIYWKTKDWAEVILVHLPNDWRDYSTMVVDIINPNEEDIVLELKISEREGPPSSSSYRNKFTMRYILTPGLTSLRLKISVIASNIVAGLDKIIHLRFFAEEEVFYLDNMWIER